MPRTQRRGPLRKVVSEASIPYDRFVAGGGLTRGNVHYELLACGHVQRPLSGIYGEEFAASRRCRKCHEHLPPDVDMPRRCATYDEAILAIRGVLVGSPPPPEESVEAADKRSDRNRNTRIRRRKGCFGGNY